MKFTATAVAAILAAPLAVSAFAPLQSTGLRNSSPIAAPRVGTVRAARQHSSTCACSSCAAGYSVILRMADVAEAETETDADVPAEVEAMDGIASSEEAHNAERPARASIAKKHKGGERSGKPLSELEIGSSVEATVKAVQSYGAFLDIGAQTDALLHVSRMSDDFVSNVEDIVKAGDTITVRIVSVDADKGQVAVTARSEEAEKAAEDRRAGGGGRRRDRPRRSGGDREAQKKTLVALSDKGYDSDKFVEGQVASVLDFGAFVRFDTSQLGEGLEGELDGLVHISALQATRTDSVSDVVSVGDTVQIRVKNLDVDGGKVALSMISKEDEPKPRERRPRGQQNQRWSPDEMGASDWADTMKDLEQPGFTNSPVLIERK
mmetsp:Transcript_28338/g.61700  ORF Transcript_28338/g.61700 Transcript_28338/m.61700 type:complete len:378 (+) Transcript_28338:112-1245(+)